MQNYCKTIGALAAASALVAGNAKAEIEYDISTGYSSMYLFRGLDYGDNLVELGLSASTEYNGFKFSGGVWASAFESSNDIQGVNNPGNTNDYSNEVDMYVQASKDFGFATLSVGYIYYWNVGQLGLDAQEIPFTISRDFGFMNAYVSYFWDIDRDNDGYTEVGASKSWTLNSCLTLNYATNIGYLMEQGQCSAWTNRLSLDWGFSENAKLSPYIAYALSMSDDVDTQYRGSENEFVGGAMLRVKF
jgi:hypothetical protein